MNIAGRWIASATTRSLRIRYRVARAGAKVGSVCSRFSGSAIPTRARRRDAGYVTDQGNECSRASSDGLRDVQSRDPRRPNARYYRWDRSPWLFSALLPQRRTSRPTFGRTTRSSMRPCVLQSLILLQGTSGCAPRLSYLALAICGTRRRDDHLRYDVASESRSPPAGKGLVVSKPALQDGPYYGNNGPSILRSQSRAFSEHVRPEFNIHYNRDAGRFSGYTRFGFGRWGLSPC